MTGVIGLQLAYMLKMGAESKNCRLSVITCTNNIATQEVTSATLQISTTAGSLMTNGMVMSYAKGLFSFHSQLTIYATYHPLKFMENDLIKVACHFLVNFPSIKCNEHNFMWCDMIYRESFLI